MAKVGGKRPGAGRKKGVPNKVTIEVKKAILEAFDKAGGVDYLVKVAKDEPKAFCALLGKIVPHDIALGVSNEVAEMLRRIDGKTRGTPNG